MTDPGGRHEGKPTKLLAVERAFHGRTGRPAQISHSCMDGYKKNLATFRDMDNLLLVPANDIEALQAMFKRADDEGFFIEMMALEPVQGEGSPGRCVERLLRRSPPPHALSMAPCSWSIRYRQVFAGKDAFLSLITKALRMQKP